MQQARPVPGSTSPVLAISEYLLGLSRPAKRFLMVLTDALMIPLALWWAVTLKLDRLASLADYGSLLFFAAFSSAAIFAALGQYRTVIRFMGAKAMLSLVGGVTAGAALLGLCDGSFGTRQLAVTTLTIYWAIALLYALGSRFFVRYLLQVRNGPSAKRVAIYGAGEAGARLCSVLRGSPDFEPVAFIDDKRAMRGTRSTA